MRELPFEKRVEGCLIGAAIGAELGYARVVHSERFAVRQAADVFDVPLEPSNGCEEVPGRIGYHKATPLIDIGIRVYITRQGRATPEDFADLFKEDTSISRPVFYWDGLHAVQELLREGMHPRISGMCHSPCGYTAPSMLGVGIYHFGDPEYAYLDGVELASVCQPRLGADWAALCAAAVAYALESDSTPRGVVDTVLRIALEHNKDLFYSMNNPKRTADLLLDNSSEEEFVEWWYRAGGRMQRTKDTCWKAYNPISFVLPLLERYACEPRKMMALLLTPRDIGPAVTGVTTVTAVIAGAVIGALYGVGVFPREWQEWSEPVARPWFPIADVVRKRIDKEIEVRSTVNRLSSSKVGGESLLFDKIYGCMLSGAIGNAMGSPVEDMLYWEIDEKYPRGITTILEPERLESEDDNQLAMLLVGTYLGRGGLPVMGRDFGKAWQERMNRDQYYPYCMGNSYDLICRGWDPRITGHWNEVTGSAVMCMEPVGMYHIGDPEFASIDATSLSYMYQRGLGVTAAAILAVSVAEAFRPDATVESVCRAALSATPKEKMNTFDSRPYDTPYDYLAACLEIAGRYTDVREVRKELYEKCLHYHAIAPMEVLGFAFAMFRIAGGDVRQSAVGGTNIGRDADTIAGRAAMLAGALQGASSIPEEWIALFRPDVVERIKRNAASFADLITRKVASRLEHRQAEAR